MTAPYFRANTVYCGDCVDVLRKFSDECVDLIYADPPFFSEEGYEIIWHDGYEIRAFEDRWKGGIFNYVEWIKPKLMECYRVLKRTGSMYLHCDWHADAHLRLAVDEIFGDRNFRNEIIWQRTTAHPNVGRSYGRLHDVILFYTKTDQYAWNMQYSPYSEEHVLSSYRNVEPETNRKYALRDLTASVYHASSGQRYAWKGKRPPPSRVWAYSKEEMTKLDVQGKIQYSNKGYPRLKIYLDEAPGVPLQDVWTDLRPVQSQSAERLGYPTQKPETLLDRIIKTSSNPTDLVLDPFCGCGTALAVAHKLGRRWIGIDISPTACNLIVERMKKLHAQPALVGMPLTEEDLRKLPPFEFQNWVIQRLFGRVSSRKSSDMGIDGYSFEGHPVQVKQSDDIGRNVVDNFETAMRRRKSDKGLIVAFSFGKGAHEEVARARLNERLDIRLVTIAELIRNRRNNRSIERKQQTLDIHT
jgi:DNA modification methylase